MENEHKENGSRPLFQLLEIQLSLTEKQKFLNSSLIPPKSVTQTMSIINRIIAIIRKLTPNCRTVSPTVLL